MSSLNYIEAEALVAVLPEENGVQVVDVREPSEFADGHIKNAVNIPSGKWSDVEFVNSFIRSNGNAKNVVFHCAKSQHRGPTCAQQFLDRLNATKSAESISPEV